MKLHKNVRPSQPSWSWVNYNFFILFKFSTINEIQPVLVWDVFFVYNIQLRHLLFGQSGTQPGKFSVPPLQNSSSDSDQVLELQLFTKISCICCANGQIFVRNIRWIYPIERKGVCTCQSHQKNFKYKSPSMAN